MPASRKQAKKTRTKIKSGYTPNIVIIGAFDIKNTILVGINIMTNLTSFLKGLVRYRLLDYQISTNMNVPFYIK